ncbi:MAG: methyltransferase family protein, partial [Gemmatimonadetes bacterium]|nr:methyltransferase family protein [Gemmatimonadota bacterium]
GWRSVLDVGCGDGLFFDRLAALDGVELVEGVEPAAALVSPGGPHRNQIHVVPFDASFEPGRRYSLVLMLDVLEHLEDPVGALRHALALLEPGGAFVATVPAFMALWTQHDELNHHFTRYDKRSFGALADAAGLQIEEARYFFRWTAAAKLVARAREALVSSEPTLPTVPASPINRALYFISRLEEKLLGAVPLPFGSSLLVVGRARAPQAPNSAFALRSPTTSASTSASSL